MPIVNYLKNEPIENMHSALRVYKFLDRMNWSMKLYDVNGPVYHIEDATHFSIIPGFASMPTVSSEDIDMLNRIIGK
jgi:hypothetical protein